MRHPGAWRTSAFSPNLEKRRVPFLPPWNRLSYINLVKLLPVGVEFEAPLADLVLLNLDVDGGQRGGDKPRFLPLSRPIMGLIPSSGKMASKGEQRHAIVTKWNGRRGSDEELQPTGWGSPKYQIFRSKRSFCCSLGT